jgi:hypothetical protein
VLLGLTLGCPGSPAVVVVPGPPPVNWDVTPHQLTPVSPGTVIGDGPPEGWTHLLVKSYPRAEAGDIDKMSSSMRELAGKIFSTMVAKVEVQPGSSPPRYRLTDVGNGIGTRIRDQDVVVNPDTYRQLGADLGIFTSWAVSTAYARTRTSAIVLRSETLALDDAPMFMLRDGRHAPVMFRYVFVLDPDTGKLETLQWFIDLDADGAYRDAHGPMQLLRPSHVEDRVVHVDASKFQFGLLTEQSLALTKLFTGRKQIPFPPDFEELARQKPFTPESAATLDRTLRRLLREEGSPPAGSP